MGEPNFIKKKVAERAAKKNPVHRGAERLAKKGDIDSGMTPEQKRKIREIEEGQADNYYEHAVAVDDKGNIVGESVVDTHKSSGWLNAPVGPYVHTHNHPNLEDEAENAARTFLKMYGKGGIANKVKDINTLAGSHIGVSLSNSDIGLMLELDHKEVRARTGNFVFSMRNSKGNVGIQKEDLAENVKADWERASKEVGEKYKSVLGKATKEFLDSPNEETARRYVTMCGRINAIAAHIANKEIAKKYGFEYTRKRVRENQKKYKRSKNKPVYTSQGKADRMMIELGRELGL